MSNESTNDISSHEAVMESPKKVRSNKLVKGKKTKKDLSAIKDIESEIED